MQNYTFWEEYQTNIAPRIAEIDLFLKTAEYPLQADLVADVLELSEREVRQILTGRSVIDEGVFLAVMSRGSSELCRLYQREMERQSPQTYSCSDIAYIYNLNFAEVDAACRQLKIKEVTAFTMPLVFSNIPYQNAY
ncbi:MAG: hypothetical protein FWB98_08750 [Defluviitaleaceae bacterium]|nr:hypothetical protein [Defluviitaleaceae bacterium]